MSRALHKIAESLAQLAKDAAEPDADREAISDAISIHARRVKAQAEWRDEGLDG